jgi:hypothetical protein
MAARMRLSTHSAAEAGNCDRRRSTARNQRGAEKARGGEFVSAGRDEP